MFSRLQYLVSWLYWRPGGGMWDSSTFLSALTPKFYVALTGTSSLISGLILIFEWWYYRKYGASFIEQVSLAHLGPWFAGGDEPNSGAGGNGSGGGGAPPGPAPGECKVWRNPMSLLRGAEYARLWAAARRAPLTYYDMNLSAQEHQAWFGVSGAGADAPAELALARAWREREPAARVAAARAALALRPDCAAALLLLAEEDAPTVQEAERVLKRAWRCAEAAWRVSGAVGGTGGAAEAARARRDAAVLAHVKRRAAMCARRLGRLRDAARLFRELARDAPPALAALHAHENLLEVLLEQRAYADVQHVKLLTASGRDIGAPAPVSRTRECLPHLDSFLVHVKRRAAMCARRLERLRDAARLFRELARDAPPALAALHAHENLLEVLLEQSAYADVQAVLARYDDPALPKSATIVYTTALLRARAASQAPRPGAEAAALEAIRRAMEFNPHVPAYLLELRALTLPPEHVLRRGDSEALAYAFCHLRHWQNAEGALALLAAACQAAERCGGPAAPYAACSACADRELLPAHHAAPGWRRARGAALPLAGALCVAAALLALAAARWPDAAHAIAPMHVLRLLHAV